MNTKNVLRNPIQLVAHISLVGLVVVLWAPFGLDTAPIYDLWALKAQVDSDGFSLLTSGYFKLRPLLLLPYYIAHLLSPNSFVGNNLLLAGLFLGKATILYGLLRRLIPRNPELSFASAVLFTVYPADGGLFNVEGLGVHFSVFFLLLAVYLLIVYWQQPRPIFLIGSWFALAVCLTRYPLAYPLILVTPLLLVWQEGKLSRRVLTVTAAWYLVPVLIIGYMVFAFIFLPGTPREEQVFIWHGCCYPLYKLKTVLQAYAQLWSRNFITGWIQALKDVAGSPVSFMLIALASSAGMGSVVWLLTQESDDSRLSEVKPEHYLFLFYAGLIVVGFGYYPYLLTSVRFETWRVYYVSSAGAAFSVCVLLYYLSTRIRPSRVVFSAFFSLALFVGLISVFDQFEYYTEAPAFENQLIASISRQVPRLTDEATMLIVDESLSPDAEMPVFEEHTFFYPLGFVDALRYVYGDYSNLQAVAICTPTVGTECIFGEEFVTLSGRLSAPFDETTPTTPVQVSYSQVVAFALDEKHELVLLDELPWGRSPELYDPDRLIDRRAPLPSRAQFTLD